MSKSNSIKYSASPNISNIFRSLINWGYYTGCCSFKISPALSDATSFWFPKLICSITYLLAFFGYAAKFILQVRRPLGNNPVEYMYTLRYAVSLWIFSVFAYTMTNKKREILKIFSHLNQMRCKEFWNFAYSWQLKIVRFQIIIIVSGGGDKLFSVANLFLSFQICSLPFLYSLRIIWQAFAIYDGIMEALPPKHIPLFRTNFYSNLQQYSKTSSNLNSTLLPLDNNDTYHHHISFDTSLGLLTILSSISRMHILYAVDHFMLTAAMGLWVPCRYFGNVLITRQDLVLPQVLEIYGDLKVLSDLLNEAFDRLVTPHLVAILLYYSTHVMDLVSHESTMDRILLLACTVINAGTLYFAAESCLYVGGPSMLYWVGQKSCYD